MRPSRRLACAAIVLLSALAQAVPGAAQTAVSVRDDSGDTVTLAAPARRVVALSPHATELVYAAGGGARLVAAVAYSDYPDAARALPRVGDSRGIDLERVLAAQPDLVVAWRSGGTPAPVLARLRALGIAVFDSSPQRLDDIASNLKRLGILLATTEAADRAAAALRARLAALGQRSKLRAGPPVRVFYQVWSRPLYTLNGAHLISEILGLCGGENVFAGLPTLSAVVDTEAVIAADPEAIVAATAADDRAADVANDPFARWRALRTMTAVQRDNLLTIDADRLNRPTPRIADGADALCAALDRARAHRPAPARTR